MIADISSRRSINSKQLNLQPIKVSGIVAKSGANEDLSGPRLGDTLLAGLAKQIRQWTRISN